MNQSLPTRKEIVDALNALPPETLPELQTFMRFLQFKAGKTDSESVGHRRQEQWRLALEATFGMWADRDDIAKDGVDYIQTVRRGHRLNDFLERIDEAD